MTSHRLIAASGLSFVLLAGCTVTTPDGVSFRKGADEEQVRAKLGEPDWTEHFGRVPGFLNPAGHPPGETLYYVDRGYSVCIFDWGLSHVYQFNSDEQADIERQRRVYRDVVPLVPVGAPVANLVAKFGEPEVVEETWTEHGMSYGRHLTYADFIALSPVPATAECYFSSADLIVFLKSGTAEKVRPIPLFGWKQVLHREPPSAVAAMERGGSL